MTVFQPGDRIRYDNGCEVWVRAYRVRELAKPAFSPQLLAVPLRADLNVQINHVSGPPVEDGDHIRRWLTGGLVLDARGDWFPVPGLLRPRQPGGLSGGLRPELGPVAGHDHRRRLERLTPSSRPAGAADQDRRRGRAPTHYPAREEHR